MLTIASAKLCGYRGDGHVRLAAAVEFMHTATLLHDDVVDESDYRRGKASARLVWGNQASVLVGDFLLGQAFRMMVEVGSLGALKILSTAAAVIAEGEVMQLAAAKNTATTEDDYLAIINAKTAALFSAATEVGAAICQPARGGAGRAQVLRPQPRYCLPARRRCARLLRRQQQSRQVGRRRFPRGQDHATRHPVLPPRQRRRARVLEAHAERGQDRGRRPRARHFAHEEARCHRGDARAGRPLRRHRPRRARHLPQGHPRQRARRRHRLLHQPRQLRRRHLFSAITSMQQR